MNQLDALAWPDAKNNIADTAARVLILVKMLLVIPFGVVVSSLVLYMTHQLNQPDSVAIGVTASFIGCTGIMRVIAGYLGDKLLSHYHLLLLCAFFLMTGCLLMTEPAYFYYGVTCIAAGSGLLIAVNCLITALFQKNDIAREAAFLRNYSGMNIGYIVSFALSGYFELHHQYDTLFMLAGAFSLFALAIIMVSWNILSIDKQSNVTVGLPIMLIVFFFLHELIKTSAVNNTFTLIFSIILTILVFRIAIKQPTNENKHKIITCMILAIPVLIFWSLYNLSPMALTLFIERNVNRHYFGFEIAPQWAQLVLTVAVVFGGPILCYLFNNLRNRGVNINHIDQFSFGLILIGISLLLLPLGIFFSNPGELIGFQWVIASFVLLGTAELLVAPTGFAMIGQLIPKQSQGMMMGCWMMLISIGATISGYLSKILLINYNLSFSLLGGLSIALGVATLVLIPLAFNYYSLRLNPL